jgi:hypothetical protein
MGLGWLAVVMEKPMQPATGVALTLTTQRCLCKPQGPSLIKPDSTRDVRRSLRRPFLASFGQPLSVRAVRSSEIHGILNIKLAG